MFGSAGRSPKLELVISRSLSPILSINLRTARFSLSNQLLLSLYKILKTFHDNI